MGTKVDDCLLFLCVWGGGGGEDTYMYASNITFEGVQFPRGKGGGCKLCDF